MKTESKGVGRDDGNFPARSDSTVLNCTALAFRQHECIGSASVENPYMLRFYLVQHTDIEIRKFKWLDTYVLIHSVELQSDWVLEFHSTNEIEIGLIEFTNCLYIEYILPS